MTRSGFVTEHGTLLRRPADGAGLRHAPLGEERDPVLLLDGLDEAFAIEPAGIAALVRLRDRRDRSFLSAGNQGGAVVRSPVARGWESFLPIDEATLAALRTLSDGDWLRHGTADPVGGVRLDPSFSLRIGEASLATAHGLEGMILGEDPPSRVALRLVADGGAPRLAVLSRFEPAVLWRNDGSEGADDEIALGIASLRACGYRGPVMAELRDAGVLASVDPGLGGVAAAPPGEALASLPLRSAALLVLNGVLCTGPIAPVLGAVASSGGLLAAPWRRAGEDPFGPAGPTLAAAGGAPQAIAIDPAVIGAPPGSTPCRRLLAAALRAGPSDAVLADALRAVAASAGTPIDPRVLDRHVASRQPGRGDTPGAAFVSFRGLPSDVRLAAMRDAHGAGGP